MVYILHFSQPYFHARHYVGFTEDAGQRLKEHLNSSSSGSPLVRAALDSGITVSVAKVFSDGDRDLERKIKKAHRTARYCPICQREASA